MIQLSDNMLLYHGSYTAISDIQLSKCSAGLDFGTGFYVTSSFEQAWRYVPSAVKKNIRRRVLPTEFDVRDGCVSVYRFHANPALLLHCFQDADANWLHFVAANRNDRLFVDEREQLSAMDILGGKIANDNTAATLNAYISGDYGVPGTARTDSFTLEGLLTDRLKDQFCFRTELALASLEFLRSERYGDYSADDFNG
jgi:hypothetical protein